MNNDVSRLIEIELIKPDNFLKVAETLTRIGLASKNKNRLVQTAHILQKRGRYYIVHYLQMLALDGRQTSYCEKDRMRVEKITCLLEDWGLINILTDIEYDSTLGDLRVIKYSEKNDWELVANYTIGKKKARRD